MNKLYTECQTFKICTSMNCTVYRVSHKLWGTFVLFLKIKWARYEILLFTLYNIQVSCTHV